MATAPKLKRKSYLPTAGNEQVISVNETALTDGSDSYLPQLSKRPGTKLKSLPRHVKKHTQIHMPTESNTCICGRNRSKEVQMQHDHDDSYSTVIPVQPLDDETLETGWQTEAVLRKSQPSECSETAFAKRSSTTDVMLEDDLDDEKIKTGLQTDDILGKIECLKCSETEFGERSPTTDVMRLYVEELKTGRQPLEPSETAVAERWPTTDVMPEDASDDANTKTGWQMNDMLCLKFSETALGERSSTTDVIPVEEVKTGWQPLESSVTASAEKSVEEASNDKNIETGWQKEAVLGKSESLESSETVFAERSPTINGIPEIVSNDKNIKIGWQTEAVSGKSESLEFSEPAKYIGLAAKNGCWTKLRKLLTDWVSESERYKALLECGDEFKSALQYLLEANVRDTVQAALSGPNATSIIEQLKRAEVFESVLINFAEDLEKEVTQNALKKIEKTTQFMVAKSILKIVSETTPQKFTTDLTTTMRELNHVPSDFEEKLRSCYIAARQAKHIILTPAEAEHELSYLQDAALENILDAIERMSKHETLITAIIRELKIAQVPKNLLRKCLANGLERDLLEMVKDKEMYPMSAKLAIIARGIVNKLKLETPFHQMLLQKPQALDDSPLAMFLTEDFIKGLKAVLTNKTWHRLFTEHEMAVKAIERFNNTNLFQYTFLLPKPSRKNGLSRPEAMIFHNNLNTDCTDERPKNRAAHVLGSALGQIGWPKESIHEESEWSFDHLRHQLKEKLKKVEDHVSILMLCVSIHHERKDAKAAQCKDLDGHCLSYIQIQQLIDIVERLDSSIPKVIIIDVCRLRSTKKSFKRSNFVSNSTVLLMGTSANANDDAIGGYYVEKLSEEIKEANGVTTLTAMHYRAAREMEDPKQIPQIITATKDIVLQNWSRDYKKCAECSKIVEKEAQYISCSRCQNRHCKDCTTVSNDDLDFRTRFFCYQCIRQLKGISKEHLISSTYSPE